MAPLDELLPKPSKSLFQRKGRFQAPFKKSFQRWYLRFIKLSLEMLALKNFSECRCACVSGLPTESHFRAQRQGFFPTDGKKLRPLTILKYAQAQGRSISVTVGNHRCFKFLRMRRTFGTSRKSFSSVLTGEIAVSEDEGAKANEVNFNNLFSKD